MYETVQGIPTLIKQGLGDISKERREECNVILSCTLNVSECARCYRYVSTVAVSILSQVQERSFPEYSLPPHKPACKFHSLLRVDGTVHSFGSRKGQLANECRRWKTNAESELV